MSEQLLKKFSIDVQEKLYETQHADGTLAVFQTHPFGKVLTLNGEIIISEQDSFFYHEMMTHPALFSHPQAQKIVVIGHSVGIIEEILKHTAVTEIVCVQDKPIANDLIQQFFSGYQAAQQDLRVNMHLLSPAQWLSLVKEKYDVIIDMRSVSANSPQENFYSALNEQGILVKSCPSFLFHFETLKNELAAIELAGFSDWQLLTFPQPSYPYGLRSALLALKNSGVNRLSEKKIFNRTFNTRYYNLDTHKAAMVMPEYMREWVV